MTKEINSTNLFRTSLVTNKEGQDSLWKAYKASLWLHSYLITTKTFASVLLPKTLNIHVFTDAA